ncbi:DUF3048 domain-containing protein [Candidatus Roizmanbacteria bacterium]|nr:DUF3048 domain-containing protein [Candidatus Roizmanbacteria bacterium]
MKSKLSFIIGMLVVYIFSSGVSYVIFKNTAPKTASVIIPEEQEVNPGEGFKLDQTLPKTEACPLNGRLYTKPEKAIWDNRRPLGVMLENHTEARPHSGLSKADVVYEAVAEGGITRFLALFYCGIGENTEFAPVRSARTYYLDWVSEYDGLYNHVGGAGICSDVTVNERAKALCQIGKYGIKDMDQFGISFPTCYRNPDRLDHPVATEHQMVCQSDKLYEIAKERGWTNVDEDGVAWDKSFTSWKFKQEAKAPERGTTATISMYWWKGYSDYEVTWEFDTTTNLYKRLNGGKPHVELETGQQLTASNVVVQFVKETGPVDEHKHMLYQTIGSGDALIFMDGNVIEGTWTKKSRVSRTLFYDEKRKEVTFNPGVIWIEAIPAGNDVTY